MPLDRDRMTKVYDHYSSIYDHVFGPVFQNAREKVIRDLDPDPGAHVLEVGVGTGLCLPLYPPGCRITGVDISQGMLRKAADRLEKQPLGNVDLIAMDAGHMSFADDSFDVVIAAYVVTAVSDHRALMREMIRVSRPGARVILLNHFRQDSRLLGTVERWISPLCKHVGFRTDLSVADVVGEWPLVVTRDDRVKPLGMWHVVECLNEKAGLVPQGHSANGTRPAKSRERLRD
jgi:phosphatidylethanolamine/phosphatidyl-N-methylethanolamine N-methyltransferase